MRPMEEWPQRERKVNHKNTTLDFGDIFKYTPMDISYLATWAFNSRSHLACPLNFSEMQQKGYPSFPLNTAQCEKLWFQRGPLAYIFSLLIKNFCPSSFRSLRSFACVKGSRALRKVFPFLVNSMGTLLFFLMVLVIYETLGAQSGLICFVVRIWCTGDPAHFPMSGTSLERSHDGYAGSSLSALPVALLGPVLLHSSSSGNLARKEVTWVHIPYVEKGMDQKNTCIL